MTAESHELELFRELWVVDSAATSHMTRHLDMLTDYQEFDVPRRLGSSRRGEQQLIAEGCGNMPFYSEQGDGVLLQVLWVPKLSENLFSVIKATKLGYEMTFTHDKADFYYEGRLELTATKYPFSLFYLLNLEPKFGKSGDKESAMLSATLEEWHKRLAHCSIDTVRHLLKSGAVDGMRLPKGDRNNCRSCGAGKTCRTHHPSRTTIKADENSAVLHLDTVGPIKPSSIGNNKYFLLATEEYSKYTYIELVARKDEIPDRVKIIINLSELESHRLVKSIVTDRGTEFWNRDLEVWLRKRGIWHSVSTQYTPEQNGRAERANRTVIEGVRTLLLSSGLPTELWGEAANTVVYTNNRLPSKKSPKTRFELHIGHKPNIAHLRTFGQQAIIKINDAARTGKFSAKGETAIFVGYTERRNTYRFYTEDPIPQIFSSCDAVFYPDSYKKGTEENTIKLVVENDQQDTDPTYPESEDTDYWDAGDLEGFLELQHNSEIESLSPLQPQSTLNNEPELPEAIPSTSGLTQGDKDADNLSDTDTVIYGSQTNKSAEDSDSETIIIENQNEKLSQHPPAFRPLYERPRTRGYTKNIKETEEEQPKEAALFTLDNEPETIREAQQAEEWPQWKKAMDEEMQALKKNGTWELVEKPPNVKPIKSKWVYKLKLNTNGEIERYKARLVAKGYSQIPNVDYKETYAPVASMTTVRMFLAIANQNNMHIVQFDIKTAFLYGELDEKLYMQQPEGYQTDDNKVCMLKKSLYGLKQAPRQWNRKFDSFLKMFDLHQASVDRCVYYNKDRTVLLAIYVDDGLAAGRDIAKLNKLIEYLRKNFELKVMDCVSYLGLNIDRDWKSKTLTMNQSHYVDKMLDRFGMTDANPVDTPEQVGVKFTDSPPLPIDNQFKELGGSLLYLATCTRPDISHAVSIATRTATPTQAHWNALKRILKYLKGTKQLGLRFRWEEKAQLIGYSDADYANDEETRKSNTGYVIFYGGAPIAWRCQRQPIITLSTTEAEYVAGCDMVKALLPIREQLIELQQIDPDEPTTVLIDNQSTVNIATNESGQQRTKHIDVRQKWLTEQATNKKITVKHVKGDDQAADLLTKPLYRGKFVTNRSKLLTLVITLMALLASGVLATRTNIHQFASPIATLPTDFKYVIGDYRFNTTITFINPCAELFNYTSPKSEAETLIKICFEYYETKLLNNLGNCKRLPNIGPNLTEIPETYDCLSSNPATDGQGNNTSQPKACKKEIQQHNLSKGPISDFTTIIDAWESHKKRVKELPVIKVQRSTNQELQRTKRFVPGLAIIAFVISGFVLGDSWRTKQVQSHQHGILTNLTDLVNEHSKMIELMTSAIEVNKDDLEQVKAWTERVYEQLGIQGQSKLTQDQLQAVNKRGSLVRAFMKWFESSEVHLKDINLAVKHKHVSEKVLEITEYKDKVGTATADDSSLLSCNYQLVNRSIVLNLNFMQPVIDPGISIKRVLPINHHIQDKKTYNFCWQTYRGPKFIITNETDGCVTKLDEERVHDRMVRVQTCNEFINFHDISGDFWERKDCTPKPARTQERVQTQLIDGVLRMYCFPHDITINNVTEPCPMQTFVIEAFSNYSVAGLTHIGDYIDAKVERNQRKKRDTSNILLSTILQNVVEENPDIVKRLKDINTNGSSDSQELKKIHLELMNLILKKLIIAETLSRKTRSATHLAMIPDTIKVFQENPEFLDRYFDIDALDPASKKEMHQINQHFADALKEKVMKKLSKLVNEKGEPSHTLTKRSTREITITLGTERAKTISELEEAIFNTTPRSRKSRRKMIIISKETELNLTETGVKTLSNIEDQVFGTETSTTTSSRRKRSLTLFATEAYLNIMSILETESLTNNTSNGPFPRDLTWYLSVKKDEIKPRLEPIYWKALTFYVNEQNRLNEGTNHTKGQEDGGNGVRKKRTSEINPEIGLLVKDAEKLWVAAAIVRKALLGKDTKLSTLNISEPEMDQICEPLPLPEKSNRKKRSALPESIVSVPEMPTVNPPSSEIREQKPPVPLEPLKLNTNKTSYYLAKIKLALTNLPKVNVTMGNFTNFVDDAVKAVHEGMNSIFDVLKEVGLPLGLLGLCCMFIMIMPLLEVTIIGVKLAKIPFNLWIGSARRVTNHMSEVTPFKASNPFRRRKKRWDEALKTV